MIKKGVRIFLFALVYVVLSLCAAPLTAQTYRISSRNLEAVFDLATVSLDVTHRGTGVTWRMSRNGDKEFVYEQDGVIHEVSLAASKNKKVKLLGVNSMLATFEDFRLELLISLDQERDEMTIKVIPLEEDHKFTIKGLIYPRAFEVPKNAESYSFSGFEQGMLIPGNWDHPEDVNNPIQFDDQARYDLFGELMDRPSHWWDHQEWDQAGLIFGLRMATFGAHQPGSGFLAWVDDKCRMDTFIHVKHTPGQFTDYKIYWRPSMGKFSYPRTLYYYFEKDAGYARLIRRYREYYRDLGYLKTLASKNQENPNVEKMKGVINLQARVGRRDHRTFHFEIFNSFHDIGEQVAGFKEISGWDRAMVSFTGWQRYGHDQEYPDIMPPNMYAGGPYALDTLARKVKDMGYLLGLATDNYCDITLDSPSFREEVTLKDSQGRYFRRSTWGAGVNSLICPRWAIRFLRRNFEVGRTDYPAVRGLLDTATPQHYLLGNYVCNWECYDHDHPLTRNENREAIADILAYFDEKKILLTIEHQNDWTVPWIVNARTRVPHEVVYGLDAEGRAAGIAVPLWQLCFHDCTYVNARDYLYSLLTVCPPSVSLPVREERRERLDQALLAAKLHRAVGWDDMVDHRFLSPDYKVQEASYSSGAKVWVDLGKRRYRITGVQGITEEMRTLE